MHSYIHKKTSILLIALLSSNLYAQSAKQECLGEDKSKWNNCFKSSEFDKNDFKTAAKYEYMFYTGEYANGKANGKGSFKSNQWIYFGNIRDNAMQGFGVLLWLDGGYYIGNFENYTLTGIGRTADGSNSWYIDAEFINYKVEGKAITYRENGSIESSGFYKNDKLIKSEPINPKMFSSISDDYNKFLIPEQLTPQAVEDKEKKFTLFLNSIKSDTNELQKNYNKNSSFKLSEKIDNMTNISSYTAVHESSLGKGSVKAELICAKQGILPKLTFYNVNPVTDRLQLGWSKETTAVALGRVRQNGSISSAYFPNTGKFSNEFNGALLDVMNKIIYYNNSWVIIPSESSSAKFIEDKINSNNNCNILKIEKYKKMCVELSKSILFNNIDVRSQIKTVNDYAIEVQTDSGDYFLQISLQDPAVNKKIQSCLKFYN
jgi:hypothetical protein